MFNRPRLLVSVRNSSEARLAREARADLIDVKEPARGPLGRADDDVIQSVLAVVGETPVSIASGEVTDWEQSSRPSSPTGWSGAQFLKLGLSGLAADPDWIHRWLAVREMLEKSVNGIPSARWIAVVYADFESAGSPAPSAIIEAAAATGCAGVLFDTWSKTGPSLTNIIPRQQLADWVTRIQAHGLLCALAGRLTQDDVASLAELGPDILGVRSAACIRADRQGPLDPAAIIALKTCLRNENDCPKS